MSVIQSIEKSVGYKGLFQDLIVAIFYVVVILYLTSMTPQLPTIVKDLFKNNIFRVIILFMILVLVNVSPGMALIVSIAFVVTMNNLQIDYFEQAVEQAVEQKMEKKEESEIAEPSMPTLEENEQTGCFDQRTFDMSKVSASLENEGELYGSV